MSATHAEMAHELRGTLAAGEPCPVCRQEVHQVPKAGAAPKVKAAQNTLATAEKAEGKARTERDRCAGVEASARTSVGDASAGVGRVEAALAGALETVAGATAALRHEGINSSDGSARTATHGRCSRRERPGSPPPNRRSRPRAGRSRRHGRISTRQRGSPKARWA